MHSRAQSLIKKRLPKMPPTLHCLAALVLSKKETNGIVVLSVAKAAVALKVKRCPRLASSRCNNVKLS
jgi:hypothetical protein